jgi:large subunit ribosomal protein L21
MFAVFVTGGKQIKAEVGRRIKIEKLELSVGDEVKFDNVVLVQDKEIQVGTPLVSGANVKAKVLSQGRHKKIQIIKFKRRKHHMKSMGHRQYFTEIEITDIATK